MHRLFHHRARFVRRCCGFFYGWLRHGTAECQCSIYRGAPALGDCAYRHSREFHQVHGHSAHQVSTCVSLMSLFELYFQHGPRHTRRAFKNVYTTVKNVSHANPPFPSLSGPPAAVRIQSRTERTPPPTVVRRCRNLPRISSPAWKP